MKNKVPELTNEPSAKRIRCSYCKKQGGSCCVLPLCNAMGQNVTYILPSRRPPFMHVCMKAGRLTSSSLTDLEHDYEVVGEGWVSLSDS